MNTASHAESNANFRPAAAEDMRTLLQLAQALYAEDSIAPFDIARAESGFRQLISDASLGRVWIILHEGAEAGYLVLTWSFSIERAGRAALIDELFVSPAFRGNQLGTRALEFAEQFCRARDTGALLLEVSHANTRAMDLYTRQGFIVHNRHLMTKTLS